jgi:hypothetical protein
MMRIFVNANLLEVDPGTDVGGAVRAFDPALADKLAAGSAQVMDARGIGLDSEARLVEGSILRVIVSARRAAEEPDANA